MLKLSSLITVPLSPNPLSQTLLATSYELLAGNLHQTTDWPWQIGVSDFVEFYVCCKIRVS